MMKALFFLIPLVAAVAMALWLRHARRPGGHRWIFHWLASLAPLGLLTGLHGLGLVTDALATVLIVPAVLGVAAFAGGALYLAAPTLLPVLLGLMVWAPRALAEGIKGAVTVWYESEPRRDEASLDEERFHGEPWSFENTLRADQGIYDKHNHYGVYADDD